MPGGADLSEAFAINNSGQVVGYSSATTGLRGFLWDSTNGMQNTSEDQLDYTRLPPCNSAESEFDIQFLKGLELEPFDNNLNEK